MTGDMTARPTYVIINDCDAPEPRMVCQWVPGIGYCYMDRRNHKADFDGMSGVEATPIEAFGFDVRESNEVVTFRDASRPCTATYRDGKPRRWQSTVRFFEWTKLRLEVIAANKERA